MDGAFAPESAQDRPRYRAAMSAMERGHVMNSSDLQERVGDLALLDAAPDEWSQRIKSAVEAISGNVPYVGGLITAAIELLWPIAKQDLWSSMRQQVSDLVDTRLLDKERAERQGDIDGIKDGLRLYRDARNHERRGLLSALLVEAETLGEKLIQSTDAIHLLPLAAIAAHLHLTLLLERVAHGRQLYDEDNDAAWNDELLRQYHIYRGHFRRRIPDWIAWRRDRIRIVDKVSVEDQVTGETISFGQPGLNRQRVCEATRDRLWSAAVLRATAMFLPAFLLHRYVPAYRDDPAAIDPALVRVTVGPFSVATMGDGGAAADGAKIVETDLHDSFGRVRAIRIREYNSIDLLQFQYWHGDGHAVGNPKGGVEHHETLGTDAAIAEVTMGFAQWLLTDIAFAFTDGRRTQRFGNRLNWRAARATLAPNSDYVVTGAHYRQGGGPSGTTGVRVLSLEWTHQSLRQPVRLVPAGSARILDVAGAHDANGASVVLYADHGGDNQRWSVAYDGDGAYVFIAAFSGRVLDLDRGLADDRAKLQIWDRHGGDNQRWRLTPHPQHPDRFRIVSAASGRALVAAGDGVEQRAVDAAADDQWWTFQPS